MKVFKNKILPIMLCAIMLSTQMIFGCLTVRARADDVNAVEWLHDHFTDAVSAIGGAVFNTTIDCWNAWKTLLGLNEEEFNDFITNGVSVGGNGNVTINDDVANSIKDFVEDYKENNPDFMYCYSYDIDQFTNLFASRQRYQAIRNLLSQSQSKTVLIIASTGAFTADPNSSNDVGSIAGGGASGFQIIVIDNPACFVLNAFNGTYPNVYDGYAYLYNDDWERIRWGETNFKCYGFSQRGDLTLSELDYIPIHGNNNISDWHIANTLVRVDSSYEQINGFISTNPVWVSYNTQSRPLYRTVNIMKQHSLGNLPYYQVPTNPNIQNINGSYNMTTTQLDNSISYGDISSYVETNSVTEYSTVVNYINNYYGSGSGGSGSGGSGSGGSGSDIDWGWLGRIGEVIGGLISALGNIVAGIIDAISELITSVTEGIPNVFGQLMEWLFPFLPDYLISLLSLTIMAVVIVSLVKLLRGK